MLKGWSLRVVRQLSKALSSIGSSTMSMPRLDFQIPCTASAMAFVSAAPLANVNFTFAGQPFPSGYPASESSCLAFATSKPSAFSFFCPGTPGATMETALKYASLRTTSLSCFALVARLSACRTFRLLSGALVVSRMIHCEPCRSNFLISLLSVASAFARVMSAPTSTARSISPAS